MVPIPAKRQATTTMLPRLNANMKRQFDRQELKLSEKRRTEGAALESFLHRKQSGVLRRPASVPAALNSTWHDGAAPRSAVPEFTCELPPLCALSPARARAGTLSSQAPKLGMETSVRSIVSQLLPAIESPKKTPKPKLPRLLHGVRAVQAVTALRAEGAALSPTPGGASSATISLPKKQQILGDFRARLLQHFRSVHDAFNEFDCIAKDKTLSLKEFQQAIMKFEIAGSSEAKVLFKLIDTDKSGEISLTEFLLALVDVSPEALLWELRCRLDSDGIRLNTLHKIFDLIRHEDRQHHHNSWDNIDKEKRLRDKELWKYRQLSRSDWSKLGAALGLTIMETERLFVLIDKDESGTIDLEEMFAALRAVAPNVSLERFVTKLLVQYGTLPDAFKAHARYSPDMRCSLIGLDEFISLATVLGVNDGNARQLWEALDIASRIDADDAMNEELFISQMKAWAPTTALDGLREEICEHFGNIAEGRRTLRKLGVPVEGALSAASFEAGLRAAGVTHCDAELVLSTVSGWQQVSPMHVRGVTLDEVLKSLGTDEMRTSPGGLKKKARIIIGNDMGPYWQQIVNLKNEVRKGLSDAPRTPCPEKGDKLFHVIQDRLSQLKEGQGQNIAFKGAMGWKKLSEKRSRRSKSTPTIQNGAERSIDETHVASRGSSLDEELCNNEGNTVFLTQ
eukprot:gnl/MRDRNA2_/MRDRNA2_92107_c0_seq1.p1 gnl/MRDRNA2_/MRDRNA2_92107_c0~~gnl/MRDRNA2_/MRDRNA2_92107_c0_seq1.p1  ORF type:complete len:681 (+),score=141.61 gnl/MRDRNA2_/MRDRNA2_92107_c0_seq1:97-2139(+)